MATDSPTAADMCTIDSLIQEVATPRTRATLQEYEGETKVSCSSSLDFQKILSCPGSSTSQVNTPLWPAY